MDKPSSFAHKEVYISCFSDDQIAWDFLFCLSSYAMLNFKDQVSQLAYKKTWDFAFTEVSEGHNILTLYRGLM